MNLSNNLLAIRWIKKRWMLSTRHDADGGTETGRIDYQMELHKRDLLLIIN